MKRRTLLLAASIALAVLVAAGFAFAGVDPQTQAGDPLDPRTYAPESTPFLTVHAVGVQRYACQANGAWLFTDPVATLYKQNGGRKATGSHYLNVATGRPVWQSQDGSLVEAARFVSTPGGPGNIAALLLQAVTTAPGGDGDRFEKTTWVQRLNTSGGVAPGGACTPGATIAVPYETDYVLWKAAADE